MSYPSDEVFEESHRGGRIRSAHLFDLAWQREAEFSDRAFGLPTERGPRGPLKHLAKEAMEAHANPDDLEEYADCFMLAIDAPRRAGFTPEQLLRAVLVKIEKCKQRTWPRRSGDADEAVEHER